MTMHRRWSVTALLSGIAAIGFPGALSEKAVAQQPAGDSVRVDQHAIGGVVTGAQGPEAGVWVIAETNSLPTKMVKIVVTDERGRYAIPDLPAATYDVWVRGYGVVDSPKVKSEPGKTLDLQATAAPDAKQRRNITRRSTGTRCWRCRRPATSRAPGRRATACP